jgi:multiple sugar transport system substrate-binding protein
MNWKHGAPVLALAALVAGCSGSPQADEPKMPAGKESAPPIITKDPVKLSFYTTREYTPEQFKQQIAEPVKRKYPNFELVHIPRVGDDMKALEKLIVSGETPDIIYSAPGSLTVMKTLQLSTDLTPYIKEHKFDLGRLEDSSIKAVQSYSEAGKLDFLPAYAIGGALYYNKDIFDKFAVPYPKDSMTWEDAYVIAQKLSRVDNGITYRGIDISPDFLLQNNHYSYPFIDGKTGQALVNTEGWKKWFEKMKAFYEIPNNKITNQFTGIKPNQDLFIKDKTLAMFVFQQLWLVDLIESEKQGLRWDLVSIPTFTDKPNTGIQKNVNFYTIPPTSKHKDEAFAVIAELLSDELQMSASRSGELSILKNPKVKEVFAQDLKSTSPKNYNAFFIPPAAGPSTKGDFDNPMRAIIRQKFFEVVVSGKDVNTALREGQEKADADLKALRTK